MSIGCKSRSAANASLLYLLSAVAVIAWVKPCCAQMTPEEAQARLEARIAAENAAAVKTSTASPGSSNSSEQDRCGIDIGVKFITMHEATRYDSDHVLPKWDAGALVTDVDPAGSAAEAGLEPGDIVSKMGYVVIERPDDISRFMRSAKWGAEYTLTYFRYSGVHVGMSEDEMSSFLKSHNGTASVLAQQEAQQKSATAPGAVPFPLNWVFSCATWVKTIPIGNSPGFITPSLIWMRMAISIITPSRPPRVSHNAR